MDIWFILSIFLFVKLVEGAELDELASDHKCTRIQRTEKIATKYESGPCIQSFKARCGWFSLDLCTFYKQEICDKNSNTTQYMYSTVYVCCEGYIEAPNGTCISKELADPVWVVMKENNTDVVYVNKDDIPTTTLKPKPLKDTQTVDEKEEGLGISRGALAGAACAIVFLIVVIAFTVIGVRKRKKRQAKSKNTIETDVDDAGQEMLTTST